MVLILTHQNNSTFVKHAHRVNSTEPSFLQVIQEQKEPLGLVHSDLCGKMTKKSLACLSNSLCMSVSITK